MKSDRHYRLLLGGVIALGLAAATQSLFGDRRPRLEDIRARTEFVVTNGDDSGPGSLREAIFAADSADSRARILVRVAEVTLRTPLPPLVNPRGIEVAGDLGRPIIDGSEVAAGVILDVLAPFSAVRDLELRSRSGTAVRVRAEGVELRAVRSIGHARGIEVLPGSEGLTVVDSEFGDGEVGIHLAPGVFGVVVAGCRFERHAKAGMWAAGSQEAAGRGEPNLVTASRFLGDRIGLALANVPLRVEGNEIVETGEAGIYVAERGAVVRGNRVRQGKGVGIFAVSAIGSEIAGNEIDHHESAGVLIKSGSGVRLVDNRVHANAFGLVTVFGQPEAPHDVTANAFFGQRYEGVIVIGGSPALRGNRSTGNGGAGLQVLDYVDADGRRRSAEPLLAAMTLSGNGTDEPVRGVYRERRTDS